MNLSNLFLWPLLFLLAVRAATAALLPSVTTQAPAAIGETAATLNGSVVPNSTATAAWFEWGVTTTYGNATPFNNFSASSSSSNFAYTLGGLLPNRTYHYRAIATNASGRANALDRQFTTTTTDAVTPKGQTFPGYVNGGLGFSFVPSVNLALTRVSYAYFGGLNEPIITLWSNGTAIAGSEMAAGTPDQIVYDNDVNTALDAGRPYSITLQNGELSASNAVVLNAYQGNGTGFTVDSRLLNYVSHTITPAGVFTNFSTNVFYLGVNFSFRVVGPRLRVFRTPTNSVVVAWPNPSTGFVLEQNADLAPSNWLPGPINISVVGGEKHVVVKPPTGRHFYRLKN